MLILSRMLNHVEPSSTVLKGRPIFRRLFFGGAPLFFVPFCFSAGKRERNKERKKRRVRGKSRTPSPKRSVGLQHPKP